MKMRGFAALLGTLVLLLAGLVHAITIEECGPLYTTPKTGCLKRAQDCMRELGIRIKWTGAGCKLKNRLPAGDGGCQCDQYCGYTCQAACKKDKQCYWQGKKCYNKLSRTVGVPKLICPPTSAPTPGGVSTANPTSSQPSHGPTSKAPTPPGFTYNPTASPSRMPSKSPSKTPSTSKPSRSPSRSPSTSKPSVSPSTGSPSQTPSTASPSQAPTMRPSSTPSKIPSFAPSHSPTCFRLENLDIIWILDGSISMLDNDPVSNPNTKFEDLKDFVQDFSTVVDMSATTTRQGYVVFSGPQYDPDTNTYFGETIGENVNVSTPTAINKAAFINSIQSAPNLGGSTDTPAAINFVRQVMFTDANRRSNAFRVVVLGTDGFPTDQDGFKSDAMVNASEADAQLLRDEDDVLFVFLKIGTDYPPNWFRQIAEKVYEVVSFQELSSILGSFLCLGPLTHQPSPVPTSSPTCLRSDFADIVWLIQGGTYIVNGEPPAMTSMRQFVNGFTSRITMSPTTTRQGFLLFAGPSNINPAFKTVNNNSNVTDAAATSQSGFQTLISGLVAPGGSTDMAGAIDFVRTAMFLPGNRRAGSQRIVILLAGNEPTGSDGNPSSIPNVETAITQLKSEDDVLFVVVRLDAAPANFLSTTADSIYDSTFNTLSALLDSGTFMCVPPP